jgi:azurin
MKTLTSLGKPATAAAPADAPPAGLLPDLSAAAMRRSLRDQGTQVVSIGTIPEQMLFDVKWFVVEAGKPVRVVLANSDAMPHNLVVGQPGSVNAIGTEAATMAPPTDPNARAYVPSNPMVLQATKLLQRGESDQLNFNAPAKPGEYAFLCTFPGHWVRMYGIMLVVPSLDAFEAKPTPPTDPVSGKPFDSQRQPQSR